LAGSLIGGYLTFGAGRKGGEATLAKRVPKKFLDKLNGWVEHHGSLSVGLAAFLPPPIPLTPFLLAAGALGMRRWRFLWSYGVGRALRYGLLAWLGMTFGRHIVRVWEKTLNGWSTRILWAYGVLVALGVAYGVWKYMSKRQAGATAVEAAGEPDVAQVG
jgi:membrane protein DedA with SNARE-associated domain